MIDPYLSDSLTKKYAGTNKPHVRMTERVIAPEWLDFVEVVTSSHIHTDHPVCESRRTNRAEVSFAEMRREIGLVGEAL
ncbi:MAG: hypothetical protein ACXW4M_06595 [Anaerolineales bacterium]